MRRILRIWPLYFVAFFGLALLNHFVPGVGTSDPLAWLAFTFFAGNWYILHHGWIAGSVDPLWSISVEEQFYIVIPVLAALAGRRTVAIVSYLLLALAYVTVLLYALHPTSGDNGEWTNSLETEQGGKPTGEPEKEANHTHRNWQSDQPASQQKGDQGSGAEELELHEAMQSGGGSRRSRPAHVARRA